MRFAVLSAAVLACALIAAGCGSSSGDSSSSDPASSSTTPGEAAPLSKVEFVNKADAACAKGKKEVETEYAAYLKKNKITKATESKESPAEIEGRQSEVIETIAIPAYKQQAEEIRALGVPSGDEATVNALTAAIDEGIKKAEEDPQAVFAGTSKPFTKADKLANEYGLRICGGR